MATSLCLSQATSGGDMSEVEEQAQSGVAGEAAVRTFLIADVRGYTRFTQEHGDERAAELATEFARITGEVVETLGGELVEVRGDEALAVFASTRRGLRAAAELQ